MVAIVTDSAANVPEDLARELAIEIVRRGRRPEAHRRAIRLLVPEVVLDEARCLTEKERQDPRRKRIERSPVADPARRSETSDERNDVVRCWARGFRDDQHAVHPGCVGLPRHREA